MNIATEGGDGMSKEVDLELFKKSKQEEQLLQILDAVKLMKSLYDAMREEGFTDEFIAIYLANTTKN